MTAPTLTEFFLARIAEDEEAWTLAKEMGVRLTNDGAAKFITSYHLPDRMLAECEAKRRIVEEHGGGADPCDAHDASFETIPCGTLRALALPYADHPDFREEWRP